jgi:hypothetical protein
MDRLSISVPACHFWFRLLALASKGNPLSCEIADEFKDDVIDDSRSADRSRGTPDCDDLVANFVPSNNKAALQAAVAMFYKFQIFYGIGCDGKFILYHVLDRWKS